MWAGVVSRNFWVIDDSLTSLPSRVCLSIETSELGDTNIGYVAFCFCFSEEDSTLIYFYVFTCVTV